jgi:hypothetical protein
MPITGNFFKNWAKNLAYKKVYDESAVRRSGEEKSLEDIEEQERRKERLRQLKGLP